MIPDDREALVACQKDIIEALKKHGCCGAFTIQRPQNYLVALHLIAPHSMMRENAEEHRLDLAADLTALGDEEFTQRIAGTLSMISALGDGEEKNWAMLRDMRESLATHLKGMGISSRNLGPRH